MAAMKNDADFYFKFEPAKWRSDEQLRACSLAARGLWIELIAIAHKSGGYVLVNGKSPSIEELARLVGAKQGEVRRLLETELKAKGVCSLREDGTIYSRRMVRDMARRKRNAENGSKGGNPDLVNRDTNQARDVSVNRQVNRNPDYDSDYGSSSGSAADGADPADGALSVNHGGTYQPVNPMAPAPAWGHRRRTSPLVVNHPGCDVVTVAACARGFCVPKFLARQWRQQLDPERRDTVETDVHIRRVVAAGLDKLPSEGGIGGTTPEKFWRDMWDEFHAANAPKSANKSSGYDPDAGRRTREELARKRELPTAVSE